MHSPTELTPELAAVVRELGRVRGIVGPNRIHWWVPDWQAAFPDATVWLAPGIADQANAADHGPVPAARQRDRLSVSRSG